MRVIGPGFGRTGTLSLRVALERLGFAPCYHALEFFDHPEHAGMWEAAMNGEPVDWKGGLARYGAVVDWPACSFYRELLAANPEAKVVLSVRDPQAWYESVLNTIYGTLQEGDDSTVPMARDDMPADMQRVFGLMGTLVFERTFSGRFAERDHAIDVFERHNAEVEATVPAERLLVYEVSDGWEPLCDFLGVPVPDGDPFPRLNDREAFAAMVESRAEETRSQS